MTTRWKLLHYQIGDRQHWIVPPVEGPGGQARSQNELDDESTKKERAMIEATEST
jgi:hypothetical protein